MGQALSGGAKKGELVQPCLSGDVEGVQKLLSSSTNPIELISEQDEAGNHALGAAACGGNIEVIKTLIGYEESLPRVINLPNGMGTSPVWLAAGYGHLEVLNMLVEKGGDANTPSASGDTPLIACLSRNHTAVALRLIELGVDVNARNRNGDSALSLCASLGNAEVMEALVVHKDFDSSLTTQANGKGIYPILAACANHDGRCVSMLLSHGASLEVKDMNGATPLHVAAHCGNVGALDAILSETAGQAIVNAQDPSGATPLWVAVASEHADAAEVLFEHGGDPSTTSQSLTIQEVAAKNGLDLSFLK